MCCQKSTPDFPFWQRGFYSIASNPAKETLSSIRDYHLPFPKEWEQMKAKANEFWFQNVSGIFRSPYPQPFLRIAAPFSREGNGTHSSTLAWKIPWMEEPGGLQSMGSLSVQHDWATSLSLFTFMHWRRKWQPTPVFLPGKSQRRESLVGCHLWGRTESDTTEVT